MKRKTLLLSALVTGLLACSAMPLSANAAVNVGIDLRVGPPAPRVVEVPPPRAGYVWAPGYWRWQGRRHVWVEGHWLRERRGYHWVPDRWDDRGEGRWHYERGHWDRD